MAIKYGPRSQKNIDQLHSSLQRILYAYADEAPASFDITVTDSFRGEAEQNKAFADGRSKKPWPTSGHNKTPPVAFDFAAYDGQANYDKRAMLVRQGAIRFVAAKLGIRLKPMIEWDLPHVELQL